jgi:hypothetical protein
MRFFSTENRQMKQSSFSIHPPYENNSLINLQEGNQHAKLRRQTN